MNRLFKKIQKIAAMYALAFAVFVSVGVALSSWALADIPSYKILIENHKFFPSELEVPSGQKVKLIVDNKDSTPEEFESYELKREKVIPGGKQATIYVGPLKAGQYPFFGEFNQATAQGKIIAK